MTVAELEPTYGIGQPDRARRFGRVVGHGPRSSNVEGLAFE